MKKECSSCNGTGKCPQCKGTGRLGYPGYGQVDTYKTPCTACQQSGVCRGAGAPDKSRDVQGLPSHRPKGEVP